VSWFLFSLSSLASLSLSLSPLTPPPSLSRGTREGGKEEAEKSEREGEERRQERNGERGMREERKER
jgi:hypothetical protein